MTGKDGKQFVMMGGKKREVFTDQDGKPFIINAKGEKEVIQQQKYETFKPKVFKDDDGKEYMFNEMGEKQEVFVNEFGDKCVKNKDGYLQPINQVYRDIKKPNDPGPPVFFSEDGRKFIQDKSGNRLFIQKDEKGNEFFVNAQGHKQLIQTN